MSIKALAILFTASAAVASPVNAQTAQQDGASLPQFMSSTAQAQLAQRAQDKKPVSHKTRQAAEVLSSKFAGTATEADANASTLAPANSASAVIDAPADPAGQAHVAILTATGSIATGDNGSKNDRKAIKKPATAAVAAGRTKPAKVKSEPSQAPPSERRNGPGNRRDLHPTPCPAPPRAGKPVSLACSRIQRSGIDPAREKRRRSQNGWLHAKLVPNIRPDNPA